MAAVRGHCTIVTTMWPSAYAPLLRGGIGATFLADVMALTTATCATLRAFKSFAASMSCAGVAGGRCGSGSVSAQATSQFIVSASASLTLRNDFARASGVMVGAGDVQMRSRLRYADDDPGPYRKASKLPSAASKASKSDNAASSKRAANRDAAPGGNLPAAWSAASQTARMPGPRTLVRWRHEHT